MSPYPQQIHMLSQTYQLLPPPVPPPPPGTSPLPRDLPPPGTPSPPYRPPTLVKKVFDLKRFCPGNQELDSIYMNNLLVGKIIKSLSVNYLLNFLTVCAKPIWESEKYKLYCRHLCNGTMYCNMTKDLCADSSSILLEIIILFPDFFS